MKTCSPVISIILGIVLIFLVTFNLPATSLLYSLILIMPIAILGGFIATILAKNNKAIYGLYLGMVWSLFYILSAIIYNDSIYYLFVILFIILGFTGGYIASILRTRLDNENKRFK